MKTIFEQVQLRKIISKNKIVRSATNDYMSNPDGTITEKQIKLYEELAKNNIGLIITGHLFVSENLAQANKGQMGSYSDIHIEGLKNLVDSVKKYDVKIVAQINHAGGKARMADECVGPSPIAVIPGEMVSRELTIDEISKIKTDFIEAAKRVKKAGFDGVQIHMAHGYLLSEFIDPNYNFRNDIYGGSAENRFRLPFEILEGVQKACGKDYPIFIKINCNAKEGDDEYTKELIDFINKCYEMGIEAVELSSHQAVFKGKDTKLYFIDKAEYIKDRTNMPLILVGGVKTLENMQEALDRGMSMVSLSRPLICQPDAVTRLINGEEIKCISCNNCFSIYHKTGEKRCILH